MFGPGAGCTQTVFGALLSIATCMALHTFAGPIQSFSYVINFGNSELSIHTFHLATATPCSPRLKRSEVSHPTGILEEQLGVQAWVVWERYRKCYPLELKVRSWTQTIS